MAGAPVLLNYGALRYSVYCLLYWYKSTNTDAAGALSNDALLLDYGFIEEDNPHDRCSLRFDLALVQVAFLYFFIYFFNFFERGQPVRPLLAPL